MTPSQFRTDFPEFADTTKFPDATITFYINLAGNMMSAERWGNLLDFGTELFVAHYVSMSFANVKAAAGGAGGSSSGPVTSMSVDKVSASFDTAAGTIDGAGGWNLTSYGVRYIQLARLIGAGPLQV